MQTMTTYDGQKVDSSSEAWRHHCEATTLLAWSKPDRLKHLQAVKAKRGPAAETALRNLVQSIWIDREARMYQAMPNVEAVERRLQRLADTGPAGERLRGHIESRMRELISQQQYQLGRTGT